VDLVNFWRRGADLEADLERQNIELWVGRPQGHIISWDEVICGVIRCAEFNGGIGSVIGEEEQGQKWEFMWLCLRFEGK
jgi:hypothetical protein